MADLTCSIAISGTVNGRKYSFSDTWTIEDVYDVGYAAEAENRATETTVGFGVSSPLTFAQDCPSFMFAVNRSSVEMGLLQIVNTGASKIMSLVLRPSQFVILCEDTNGGGLLTTNSTPTTTVLEEVAQIYFDKTADIGFVPRGEVMVAFQAST